MQASPALGQKCSLNDLENIVQVLFAGVMHVQRLPSAAGVSSSLCLLADEITVTAVTTVGFFSKGDRGGFFSQTVRMLSSQVWKPAAARLCRLA